MTSPNLFEYTTLTCADQTSVKLLVPFHTFNVEICNRLCIIKKYFYCPGRSLLYILPRIFLNISQQNIPDKISEYCWIVSVPEQNNTVFEALKFPSKQCYVFLNMERWSAFMFLVFLVYKCNLMRLKMYRCSAYFGLRESWFLVTWVMSLLLRLYFSEALPSDSISSNFRVTHSPYFSFQSLSYISLFNLSLISLSSTAF